MKNIQVIDGALNCTYDLFAVTDEDFRSIFPLPGQDVEFIEDFVGRVGESVAEEVCRRLWNPRVDKKTVTGIHATLYFGLENKKSFIRPSVSLRWLQAWTDRYWL